MTKILIDTNVIIDFALKREPFFNDTVDLFRIIYEKKARGYITATSVTDIFYILTRSKEMIDAKEFIRGLFKLLDILNVDKKVISEALNSDFVDFEDAVQNFSAVGNEIDIIVTRNNKDFVNSSLPILTPKEFLLKFN